MNLNIILRDGKPVGLTESDAAGINVLAWFNRNVHAYSMAHAIEHEGYRVEPTEEIDCHAVSDLLAAIAARVGLAMETTFVPFSQSDNAKPSPQHGDKSWQSLNWKVRLTKAGREILTTPYAQGEAWAPAYKWAASSAPERRARKYGVQLECEGGKFARRDPIYLTGKPLPAPPIGDVLHSLVLDADAIDYANFDDWARELGYDTDSRTAEKTYRVCLDIATRLRAAVGAETVAEMRLAASFN